jgi:DNA-binding PadR family transcriptional regulator
VLHILLALSTQERHGYGIMKQVESDSHGKVKMGPGTLYGSLGRMIEAGLIRESDKKIDARLDDERRVYYKITALGQKALSAELQRYREVVAVARRLSPSLTIKLPSLVATGDSPWRDGRGRGRVRNLWQLYNYGT